MTAPWFSSVLIVSTSCKSSSLGIASPSCASHLFHRAYRHRQSRYAPRGPHLQASRQETRQSEAASVHARTVPRPPHARAPTIPHGQSQQRAEAAASEAVHLACPLNTHKGRMNCFLEARRFGDLPLRLIRPARPASAPRCLILALFSNSVVGRFRTLSYVPRRN
jgi:hypothetical protein